MKRLLYFSSLFFVATTFRAERKPVSPAVRNYMEEIVSIRNFYSFATSVVYTNSCRTGKRLMDTLAMAGCYGYVGYTDIVKLPENEQDDMLFIACENKGLTHFLNTEDSLTKSVEVMKQQYRKQYDDFRAQKMNVAAAFLLHNLGCLTLYDPQGVTRSILEQQD